MILGSLCLLGSCTGKGKGRDYLLKPAGMFFAFAGRFRSPSKLQTFQLLQQPSQSTHASSFTQTMTLTPCASLSSGICAFISLEVMRQSVKSMIESKDTIWIAYYYAWSFACACSGFVLLFLAGIALLVLSMPQMPRNPWETCMDAEPEQVEWCRPTERSRESLSCCFPVKKKKRNMLLVFARHSRLFEQQLNGAFSEEANVFSWPLHARPEWTQPETQFTCWGFFLCTAHRLLTSCLSFSIIPMNHS